MIKSDLFYPAFESALTAATPGLLQRQRGKLPKFTAATATGPLSIWFKVNAKASAIPYQPGEFWPVIEAATLRYGERDSGTVSWHQYTTPEENAAILDLNRRVYAKTQAQDTFENDVYRQMRDIWLNMAAFALDQPLLPGHPHTGLHYLDEEDAHAWGALFGQQLEGWLQRFNTQPETLEMYMWRVHWQKD
jgi:hypothetical protein